MPSQLPFNAPCFCMASAVYLEHDGVYLHWLPISGDRVTWYALIKNSNIAETNLLINLIGISF
jgi:hypothetical protein